MRYVIQRLAMWGAFACVLLASAGRLSWPRGSGYLLATLLLEGKTLVLLAAKAQETLKQRGTFGRGMKPFDRVFAVLFLALSLGTAVVAGLDAVRLGWSTLPNWLFWPGVAVLCLADAFGTWAIVGALVTPVILGSTWTFVPAGLCAALFVVRTGLEDRTLMRELPGYREYAARTRSRLLPELW